MPSAVDMAICQASRIGWQVVVLHTDCYVVSYGRYDMMRSDRNML